MDAQSTSPLLDNAQGIYTTEASTISRIYIEYQKRNNRNISKKDEDILRKNYLAIMKRRTWKDELIAVAETLINELKMSQSEISQAQSTDGIQDGEFLDFRYGLTRIKVRPEFAKVVTIGRCKGCDIVLQSSKPPWTCSRLHAVIYVLPLTRKLIIADVGSFHGIRTVWRSSNLFPRESSVPGGRHLMEFSLRESFWLKLGSEFVICNGLTTEGENGPYDLSDSAENLSVCLDLPGDRGTLTKSETFSDIFHVPSKSQVAGSCFNCIRSMFSAKG